MFISKIIRANWGQVLSVFLRDADYWQNFYKRIFANINESKTRFCEIMRSIFFGFDPRHSRHLFLAFLRTV